ncbi:MAG: hypothetical protein JST86_01780 [Bacteroidetes bacterium]|nr:hypothetical protein [Bacteroidota bacterium]
MKYIFLIAAFISFSMNIVAQKQTFDVVSYSAPQVWQKTQNESGLQLSVADKKTGGYAVAVITKATTVDATAGENFNTDWARLVQSTVPVTAAPTMQDPATQKGWDIVSGNADYTDGNKKGHATLITATSSGQTVSVVIMTNTEQYQTELMAFINSLEWQSVKSNTAENNDHQLTGIWGQYSSESYAGAGGSSNLTAGYDWREYYFNADGTYQFLQKNISYLYQNEIVFAYEKGIYKLKGDQLIITPQSGTVESWSKAGSDKADRLLKTEKRTLENVIYTINFHYFAGIQKTNLVLQYNKPTVRDGAFSTNASFKNSWLYGRPYNADKPQIELPAGTQIDFKYKTGTTSAASNTQKSTAIHSPLTGKIWEGTTSEKYSNAGGTSYNTGGFSTNQYTFNTDGTYRFVSVTASHFTDTKSFDYESGTYSTNANQLTISPVKGYHEEWSKTGKTSNSNSDVTNRAINETWGKKLKTSGRKLESVTYTFSIGKNGNRTALILQYRNGHTEREGNGSQVYLNETAKEKSVQLPAGIK